MTTETIGLADAFSNFKKTLDQYRLWTSKSHSASSDSVVAELSGNGAALELSLNALEPSVNAAVQREAEFNRETELKTKLHEISVDLTNLTDSQNYPSEFTLKSESTSDSIIGSGFNLGANAENARMIRAFRALLKPIIDKLKATAA